MSQTTSPTQTEAALEQFRQAGVPIHKAARPYRSKRMEGFNAEVYAGWIERWANNAAINYPVVRHSEGVRFLRNIAKDIPAIVIGIGPSLDDEINALRLAPRHAVIIATDAALRPLLRHEIKPDLVVNYDARDEQKTMWSGLDTHDLVLLANSVTSPETIDAWQGKIMFFNMMQNDDEFASNILPALFPFLGQLPNLGTVGNGAVFLAYQMGCKPIITVGMDMCYRKITPTSDNGAATGTRDVWKYRCKDWVFDYAVSEWKETENKTLYDNDVREKGASVEMIKDKEYMTDECLRFYRNSLVSNIGGFDMPVINCSSGALSDLIKTMPLQQALEEKCYAALDPARTALKHLNKLIPDGKQDWTLCYAFHEINRFFIPKKTDSMFEPLTQSR